jgi:ferritin
MTSKTMIKNLNEQVQWEFYSAYLYLAMSAHLQNAGLPGFAHWMRMQAQEELAHALKFYDFLLGRGAPVKLAAVDAPPPEWKNPQDVFEKTLEHERAVTTRIGRLMALARKEEDFAAEIFLQWFVTEQTEEEASVSDVLNRLKLIKGEGNGLFMLDRELAARAAPSSAPTATEA